VTAFHEHADTIRRVSRTLARLSGEMKWHPEAQRVVYELLYEMVAKHERVLERNRKLAEALRLMRKMHTRHDLWCGYNKNSPGDQILNEAIYAADAALAEQEEGQ